MPRPTIYARTRAAEERRQEKDWSFILELWHEEVRAAGLDPDALVRTQSYFDPKMIEYADRPNFQPETMVHWSSGDAAALERQGRDYSLAAIFSFNEDDLNPTFLVPRFRWTPRDGFAQNFAAGRSRPDYAAALFLYGAAYELGNWHNDTFYEALKRFNDAVAHGLLHCGEEVQRQGGARTYRGCGRVTSLIPHDCGWDEAILPKMPFEGTARCLVRKIVWTYLECRPVVFEPVADAGIPFLKNYSDFAGAAARKAEADRIARKEAEQKREQEFAASIARDRARVKARVDALAVVPLDWNRVDEDQLQKLVWSMPATKLGSKFGVSSVAVAKRCRKLGIPVPPRGFWNLVEAGHQPHPGGVPAKAPSLAQMKTKKKIRRSIRDRNARLAARGSAQLAAE